MYCLMKNVLRYISKRSAGVTLLLCVALYFDVTAQIQPQGRERVPLPEGESPALRSSIIDDSTKLIYGPHTSLRFTEEEVFFNRIKKEPIDTNIWDFHRYLYIQRLRNKYQDLGNNGTAANPIFIQAPSIVGASDGYHVYDIYFNRQDFEYLDTKSPYSYMDVVLGGKGRSMTEVGYSRNINPEWNFGFNFRGIFTDKQLLRAGRGDRQVNSNYYDLHLSHFSKDGKYKLLANHRRMNHKIKETGGVLVRSNDMENVLDLLFDASAQPWLSLANTSELRTHFHVYQEYGLKEFFQVYHRLDREKRLNRFTNQTGSNTIEYFNFLNPVLDSASASDRTKFVTLQQEAGIKGSVWKLFYNGFVKLRQIDFTYNHLGADSLGLNAKRTEFYLGGRGGLHFNDEQYLEAEMEVMQDGNYRLHGIFTTNLLKASASRSLVKPGFVHQVYRGAYNEWFNTFDDIDFSQLDVSVNLSLERIRLSPGVNYTDIGNYVFFRQSPIGVDQLVLPIQSSGRQRVLMPRLNFEVEPLKKVFFKAEFIYSQILENADNAIQLPDFFVNTQLAYRHDVVGKNIGYHFGVDVHWRSAYYALGYATALQQFYVQQSFLVPDYPLIDPFFNLKMRRARIFVRYHNALATIRTRGFIQTPFYAGMENIFDFGFNWTFFD